ncbi:hypothetical protein EG329_013853 [Mollisiaceae sp. DMI_Dod_QoI]|nr:hypothetical protein EG329_013853 [Helotiales sp. DMI_Dod_QoI]
MPRMRGLVTLHPRRISSASGIDRSFSSCRKHDDNDSALQRSSTVKSRPARVRPLSTFTLSPSVTFRILEMDRGDHGGAAEHASTALAVPTDLSSNTLDSASQSRLESPRVDTFAVPYHAKEGSQDVIDKYDGPNYHSPKWPKPRPKIWEPFLDSFTIFPQMPIEVRQAVWKMSLRPRVIEIEYNKEHGFYSRVKPPIALSVCKDSRDAVEYLYPLCFGNVIHEPAIVFNFSMDTLYFDTAFGSHTVPFLFSLKQKEAENIQALAFDRSLDDYFDEWIGWELEAINALEKYTRSMPALKEVYVVCRLDKWWHEHGFPEGGGPIELMESFSHDLQQYMYHELFHLDDEDGASDCQELPHYDDLLESFQAPTKGAIWGWRPTDLPLQPYPWDRELESIESDGGTADLPELVEV